MKASGQKPTTRAPTRQGKNAPAAEIAKPAKRAPAPPKDAHNPSSEVYLGSPTARKVTARAPTRQVKPAAAAGMTRLGKHAPTAPAHAYKGFSAVYLASPTDRIHLIRAGVPATALLDTGARMGVSKEGIMTILKLPRSTVTRHLKAERVLPTDFSERFLGLQQLIGQVEVMVGESGDPAGFDAAHWVAGWLERPLPALNNAKPADYMDTMQGQMLVASLLASMQSGAFA